jgi:tetratricopeptide (TPR) repeat protein
MDAERRAKVRELLEAENWPVARAVLDHASQDDRDVEWLALLAEVEAGEGHSERALSAYQRVLDERPRHPAALYNRALVLLELQRFDDAVSDLEDLVEVEGPSIETLALLAEAYLGAEFFVPAWLCAQRWEACATEADDRWDARIVVARSLAAMGRVSDARDSLREALSDTSMDGEGRQEAAVLLRSLEG